MLSLGNEDLDVREVGAGAALLVLLDDSAHAVLEELEEDVVEVGRGVHQRQRHLLTLLVHHLGLP